MQLAGIHLDDVLLFRVHDEQMVVVEYLTRGDGVCGEFSPTGGRFSFSIANMGCVTKSVTLNTATQKFKKQNI